jgi:GAF domain-containing protein
VEAQILQRVNEVSAVLVRTPGSLGNLNSILRHIAQTAQDAFATDACVILAFNPITSNFIGSQIVVGDLQVKTELLHDKPRPNGVTQQVLKEGIVLVPDLEITPQYHNPFTSKEGIRSFAGLAILSRHRKRPLGVIYLDFRQPKEFNSMDYENFKIFTTQATLLLQETWLELHLEEVARIGQEINHNLAFVENLFQELQTYVDNVLDDSHTLVLGIYQLQTNTLDLHIREQKKTIFMNIPLQGTYKDVIETQTSRFIQELSAEAEHDQLPIIDKSTRSEQMESLIVVPLTLRGEPLGILSIQHPLPKAYGQEDHFVLKLLANYIALALHNIRLYSSLTELNETGQILTQQLESEQTLEATVEKIRDATKADIVVLFPYEPLLHSFILPPRMVGNMLDPTYPKATVLEPDDIAVIALDHKEPIFAKDSDTTYAELRGFIQEGQENFKEREKIRSAAVVPLRVGEEAVGVLFVNFRQPQRFDGTQKLLIEGLAHYAAIAIKNAHEYSLLIQRRVRELEILQNIDLELSSTLDLGSVLNTLLKLANEQVHAEEASILLRNPHIRALEIPAALGPHAEARRTHIISLQETKGITRWVFEHKKPARVDNVYRDPQWRGLYIEAAAETVSELDVPLLDGGEVVGVLNFESPRERAFRQEDEDFLLTLAGQAVLAIKNAQAYEREKRLAEEGRVLNEISKEITSQLDHVRVFNLILEKALELTHSTLGALWLYDPIRSDLWIAAEHGLGEDKKHMRILLNEGIVGYVATRKQFVNVEDVSCPPWNEFYIETFSGIRSELAVPMLASDELRGVLNVESSALHHFKGRDERLLQGLADLAVVALQNTERYEKARRDAQRFELLYQAGRELSKITDLTKLERAYDIVLRIAEEQSQSLVLIRRFNKDAQELELIRASQPQFKALFLRRKLDVGINGQVARERRTLVVSDIENPPSDLAIPQPSDQATRSRLVTPIMFEEQYYGNLGLNHREIGHFQNADILFFEGLAQLLASTIHRLETAQERQEFEQRALAAEEMSLIGQSAFEVTHRLGNDLGLVNLYISDIHSELEKLGVANGLIFKKLNNISQAVQHVLSFSGVLKLELAKLGAKEEMAGEPTVISSRSLLGEAQEAAYLPANISICLQIENDVAMVQGVQSLVTDILRNLVANAIQAMPGGGTITLKSRNAGRYVALEVSDTGVGIAQERISQIFGLFFSTKGSSGFGLWSARRNALRNHGDLMVESKLGEGTTFTLLLPRADF